MKKSEKRMLHDALKAHSTAERVLALLEVVEETAESAMLDECDWCHRPFPTEELAGTGDIDEGVGGPMYRICPACMRRYTARLNHELRQNFRLGAGEY